MPIIKPISDLRNKSNEISELARLGLEINKERFFENHPKVY